MNTVRFGSPQGLSAVVVVASVALLQSVVACGSGTDGSTSDAGGAAGDDGGASYPSCPNPELELAGTLDGNDFDGGYCLTGGSKFVEAITWERRFEFEKTGLFSVRGSGGGVEDTPRDVDVGVFRMPSGAPGAGILYCIAAGSTVTYSGNVDTLDLALAPLGTCDGATGDGALTLAYLPDGPSTLTGVIDGASVDETLAGFSCGSGRCEFFVGSGDDFGSVYVEVEGEWNDGAEHPVTNVQVVLRTANFPQLVLSCGGEGSVLQATPRDAGLPAIDVELRALSPFAQCGAAGGDRVTGTLTRD